MNDTNDLNAVIRKRLMVILRKLDKYEPAIGDLADELREISKQTDLGGEEMDEAVDILEAIDFGGVHKRLTEAARLLP